MDSVVGTFVAARVCTPRICSSMFEPVCISVPAIVARPPTSAVDGRSVNPARRTAGLLFILAASTRELRPTVLTVASRFSRAVFVCTWAEPTRDAAPVLRTFVEPRPDVVGVDVPFIFKTRDPTRTTSDFETLSDCVAPLRFTTARADVSRAVTVSVFVAGGVTDERVVFARAAITDASREPVELALSPVDTPNDGITRDAPLATTNGAKHAIIKRHNDNFFILVK